VSKLDDILAAAREGAANLPALSNDAGTSVAQTGTAGTALSMDNLANSGGMDVETFVTVNFFGIRLSKDWVGFIDEFEGNIDLRDVAAFMGIQKTVGKNVEYFKTYDGSTSSRGESWRQVVEDCKATSQKEAAPYPGADIPITLTAGYADPKDAKKAFEADTVVGLTTSITGFKPWKSFYKKLQQAGLNTSTIKVKISHSPRKNAAGQEYGVYEFELLDIVDDNRPAALTA
jgi:hypothetical protein